MQNILGKNIIMLTHINFYPNFIRLIRPEFLDLQIQIKKKMTFGGYYLLIYMLRLCSSDDRQTDGWIDEWTGRQVNGKRGVDKWTSKKLARKT